MAGLSRRLRAVALWRWAVLYVVLAAWLLSSGALSGEQLPDLPALAWLLQPPWWPLSGLLTLALALAFTLSWRERLTGGLLFGWLGLLGLLEMAVRDDSMPPLANLLAGNMILAWLIGSALPGTAALKVHRGHAWMSGTFGAMLALAGLSKLRHSGLDWFDGGMHALFIWERAQPMVAPEPVRLLRLWLADQPALCLAGACFALAVECSGPLFAWAPARKPMAVALFFMFTSMNIALGLGEQGWVAVPMALAWTRLPQLASSRRHPQP